MMRKVAEATESAVRPFGRRASAGADSLGEADRGFHHTSDGGGDPRAAGPWPDGQIPGHPGNDPRRPFRMVTWNIAGGRRSLSWDAFDYDDMDLQYFAERLRRLQPDVINVQESEIGGSGSTARKLAELLGYPHVFETGMCPSHLGDPTKTLSLAVLSRLPMEGARAQRLPTTRLDLKVGGNSVEPYDRYAQRVTVGGVDVVNLHPTPLGFFGHSYEEGDGAAHAAEIGSAVNELIDGPTVIAADLNTDRPALVYGRMFEDMGMDSALDTDARTVPGWDGAPDQIYSSREFRTVGSGVVATGTDHHLVWADLEITDARTLDTLAAARETGA
ncbi:MAG: endonuclease/exonuclease/phosphatase family protein [Nocardia sp.]|nr:endonuclease/exonuclease/phosphatase family protein [Nocardia sp.]